MAGSGYIVLNAIRVLNIVALTSVAIASWVMLVMTLKTSSFYFFDGSSHFITSVISCFLIVSECNLFQQYFTKNWPNLGPKSGFVPLGLAMVVLGFNTLGNLNKQATNVENLGLPLWRLVIAAGILSTVIGVANIIATFIFSDIKLNITGRQVRDHGATTYDKSISSPRNSFSLSSGSMRKTEPTSLPSYHRNSTHEERRKSRFGLQFPIRISGIGKPIPQNQEQFAKWDDRSSPVAPEVQRPPTALHPALSRPEPAFAHLNQGPRSSVYSEVSNMTRF
ncbi:hypothetical protein BJ875DRAFT_375659 [Amylocarpus encephaloides]|uniref:DUF7598 domain-containing protein n=1 Tax=Amylocarpus encephaloides TaxID=45428 RepID=A0A9P7YJF2_9HELO|nr:hypothetical protein BJ875DRAFT_375659 [Amylocarpus encephaloides]